MRLSMLWNSLLLPNRSGYIMMWEGVVQWAEFTSVLILPVLSVGGAGDPRQASEISCPLFSWPWWQAPGEEWGDRHPGPGELPVWGGAAGRGRRGKHVFGDGECIISSYRIQKLFPKCVGDPVCQTFFDYVSSQSHSIYIIGQTLTVIYNICKGQSSTSLKHLNYVANNESLL